MDTDAVFILKVSHGFKIRIEMRCLHKRAGGILWLN